jgi:hypothetical protein
MINDVVYAEFSFEFLRLEEVEAVLRVAQIDTTKLLERPCFWPARFPSAIVPAAAAAPAYCRISLSGPMRRSPRYRC